MDPYKTQSSLGADDFFGNSRDLSLQKFLKRVRKKWWYFQISLPICLLLAFAHTHFTVPKYLVGTKLITPERTATDVFSNERSKEGFGISQDDMNILNEVEVLKSYGLAERVANAMDIQVSQYIRKRMKNLEEYGSAPYTISLDPGTHQILNEPIQIEIIDNNSYAVTVSADKFWATRPQDENSIEVVEPFSFKGVCKFGADCETRFFKFTLNLQDWAKKEGLPAPGDAPDRFFKINSKKAVAAMIQGGVSVEIPVEKTTVLSVSMETTQPQKGIDILNELSKQYQRQRIDERNKYYDNTIALIDQQLGSVEGSQDEVNQSLENLKKKSSMNSDAAASRIESEISKLRESLSTEQLKYNYLSQVQVQLDANNFNSLSSPAGVGINDQILTTSILELKDLNSRKTQIEYSAPKSPELQLINQQIDGAKNTLRGQIGGLVTQYGARVSTLRSQIGRLQGQLSSTISGGMESISIEGKSVTNQEMIQWLQKRRAEAALAKQANVSDIQVLESARLLKPGPVSPNVTLTLALAVFLGLFIPLAIMVGQEYFISKIEDLNDLGNYTRIPVITSVPHGSGNDVLRTGSIDKVTLESFRFLKLKLMGLAEDENFQVVSVTSYIPSEGKNYCATNLATAIAVAGKKTIMLDADMRKLPVYYNKSIGLSEYLNEQTTLEEIIQQTDVENLYYITSGEIAERPTELLESRNMRELLMQLKTEFDYIIINTPPVGIVSDLFVLSKSVDISLFVVRHNYTPVEHLGEIDKIREVTGIRETYIIYNDVDKEADKYRRYGQNYGYLGGAYEEITINQNGSRSSSIKN